MVQLLPSLVRQRADRLARAAGELGRLSPIAQVARREDALRERARRIDSAAASRLARSTNAFASRRAGPRPGAGPSKTFARGQPTLRPPGKRRGPPTPDRGLPPRFQHTHDGPA